MKLLKLYSLYLTTIKTIVVLFMLSYVNIVQAQDNSVLFSVIVDVEKNEPNEKKAFNKALNKAIKIELVRLTGDSSILDNPDIEVFTKNSQRWLETFSNKIKLQDGVDVGELLKFTFLGNEIIKQLEELGLRFWPMAERPKVLVLISQLRGDQKVYLTQQNIDEQPQLDFRPIANQLGLPVVILSRSTLTQATKSNKSLLQKKMQEFGATKLLTIKLEQSFKGSKKAKWSLYSQDVVEIKTGRLDEYNHNKDVFDRVLKKVILNLVENKNSVDHEIIKTSITVNGISSFTQIEDLKNYFGSLKPLIHEITLLGVGQGSVDFEISYQGEYHKLLIELSKVLQYSLDNESLKNGKLVLNSH